MNTLKTLCIGILAAATVGFTPIATPELSGATNNQGLTSLGEQKEELTARRYYRVSPRQQYYRGGRAYPARVYYRNAPVYYQNRPAYYNPYYNPYYYNDPYYQGGSGVYFRIRI